MNIDNNNQIPIKNKLNYLQKRNNSQKLFRNNTNITFEKNKNLNQENLKTIIFPKINLI